MAREISEDDETSTLHRLRSSALLVALVVVLGSVSAAIVGVLIVSVISLLDHALG